MMVFTFLSCNNNTKKIDSSNCADSLRQQNIAADNQYLKAIHTGDASLLEMVIDSVFVNHRPTGDIIGIDTLKASVTSFYSRVNNLEMEVLRQWADDEYVADWVRYKGNNLTTIEGIEVTRYSNKKAVEHWFFPKREQVNNK